MNTEQARSLVRETFQQKFDKSRFRVFTINLLNHIDESNAKKWGETSIKDAFKNHVRAYECLGTYTSPEKNKLDVLVVYLTTAAKLTHARTAIRNFVAEHLKTRGNQEAALVAFVSRSEQQWRFSYVTMEYAAVKTEDGKVSMKTRLTSARRSSYLVGEDESCHTAQSRFLDLLQDTESRPTLAQVEDAFSVEAVTKEFFEHYKTLFLGLRDELDSLVKKDKNIGAEFAAKHISTVDFAKKLMGQIIFLYFLQKKGWLGAPKDGAWGDGPHGFLRQLLDGNFRSYKNFFDDILEPLFYDTLATDRGHEAWCKTLNCRIPFLNGGLFEPLGDYDWRKTDISIPNERFSNPDRTDAGDIGTGIFDVFDRYNFTVNEAEPLEKEVAIDPEMLGKVFENLLEVKERKSKGSFYTPREIVHYMCQESLINYLNTSLNSDRMTVPRDEIEIFVHSGDQTASYEAARLEGTSYQRKLPKNIETHARVLDDKLADIAVCDPAIGSGAFPVGMMQEIVRARTALTPYFNDVQERTAYQFKRHAIQSCLYGVDIDSGAVEIAKLRLWLSLVVDEDDVRQIKPLPNLDYKVVTGNSLLSVKKYLQNMDLFSRLEELKPLYFDATNQKQKKTLKHEIDGLIEELTNAKEEFDFEIYFSEVFHRRGGFDVVVANPPYVGEKGHKEIFRRIAASPIGKRFYVGKMDMFYFFFHLAIDLVRETGSVAFITTNYYVTATGASRLRSDLKTRSTVTQLVNFNELRIFESARGQHNMISIFKKAIDPSARARTAITARSGNADAATLNMILDGNDQSTSYHWVPQDSLYEGDEYYICLGGASAVNAKSPMQRIFAKMQMAGTQVGRSFRVNQGVVSSADKVSRKHLERHKLDANLGDGIFVMSVEEIKRLRLTEAEARVLKPWFKNSDIHRWVTSSDTNSWLIFADKRLNNLDRAPRLKQHLLRFKSVIDQSSSNSPYLHRPRNIKFDGPKVVAPQRSITNTFGYNAISWFASADVYFITHDASDERRLKALLALLNSRLYFLWFYHKGKRKGEQLELYQTPLAETPLPNLRKTETSLLATVADRILAAKGRDADADVTAFEREIDELVYALYGLTAAERAIVEAKTDK